MAAAAKSKNPEVGKAKTKILESISGGKILSLTDMHFGAGLDYALCDFNSIKFSK